MILTAEELLEQLKTNKFVIFGAGFAAEMFYRALKLANADENLLFCVVTKAVSGQEFHGRPVISLDEARITEETPVCLAVHEAAAGSAFRALEPYKDRTVWVYPYLPELLYGKPVRTEKQYPLAGLLAKQDKEEYWLAVRYAAVRDYLAVRLHPEGTDPGVEREYRKTKEIYLRALSLHCGKDTALLRASRMEETALSIARDGFREDCPVKIDTNGRIIDGLHRIACAAYLGLESVPAAIYQASPVYDELFGDKNRLPAKTLSEANFTVEEIRILDGARDELFPEISVILPVYNVGEYLGCCMESLERQTLRNFEMLLIDDGSSDGSGARCRDWAGRDRRIRLIVKENGGVASARNLGVRLARGKYLAFVDPDDWLDPAYLEKLYKRLEETGADFAECDLWRYDNRTGKKIYRSCGSRTGKPYTLREHMKYGPTAVYKSMSRLSMWRKFDIRMPDCAFESPAVYALVLALSGRVENIPEALYYYRRFRENSLIENGYALKDGSPNNTLGVEAMEFLTGEFRRCGLYETYRDTLEGVVKYRLNDILAMQFHRKEENDFRMLVNSCRAYLDRSFPEGHNEPYITWGGYNLNRVLSHMDWLHDPSCRFNFSSIVSVCGKRAEGPPTAEHKNRYRKLMIEREREQTFWESLREVHPEYLFIDLVEERFDLIHAGGGYVTKSDAYDGLESGKADGTAVCRFGPDGAVSPECDELWKDSADKFVRRIRETVPDIRPVVVETLLCETTGDITGTEPFAGIEEIRKVNRLLSSYYDYLEKLWPEAEVIRFADDPLRFTDRKFEYGAIPSHMNELLNQELAKRIERMLGRTASGRDPQDV